MRAVNPLQKRVKEWWAKHPEVNKDLAIISRNKFRSVRGKRLYCGTFYILHESKAGGEEAEVFKLVGTNKWIGIIEEHVTGIFKDEAIGDIQSALLAISGLDNIKLSRLLGIKPSILKRWISGTSKIPDNIIEQLTKKYLH